MNKFKNTKVGDKVFSTTHGIGTVNAMHNASMEVRYGDDFIYNLYISESVFTIYKAKQLGWLDKKGQPYTCDKCNKFMQQPKGVLTTLNARCSDCWKQFIDGVITPNPNIKIDTQAWIDDMQRISDEQKPKFANAKVGDKIYSPIYKEGYISSKGISELEIVFKPNNILIRCSYDLEGSDKHDKKDQLYHSKEEYLLTKSDFLPVELGIINEPKPDSITWPLELDKINYEKLAEHLDNIDQEVFLKSKIDWQKVFDDYVMGREMSPIASKFWGRIYKYMRARYGVLNQLPLKKIN